MGNRLRADVGRLLELERTLALPDTTAPQRRSALSRYAGTLRTVVSRLRGLEQSRTATAQQQDALEQVSRAMVDIRAAAEQLSGEQAGRLASAERVEGLVQDLDGLLGSYGIVLDEARANGDGRR